MFFSAVLDAIRTVYCICSCTLVGGFRNKKRRLYFGDCSQCERRKLFWLGQRMMVMILGGIGFLAGKNTCIYHHMCQKMRHFHSHEKKMLLYFLWYSITVKCAHHIPKNIFLYIYEANSTRRMHCTKENGRYLPMIIRSKGTSAKTVYFTR